MQNYVVVATRPDGSILLYYVRAWSPLEAQDAAQSSPGVAAILGVWANTPANAPKIRLIA